jgi:DNA-binding MarR family transcriptional regulator
VAPPGGRLNAEQQRAWLAFMRLQLRMTLSVTELAALIGWERSRASHHAKRIAERGPVGMTLAARDRRVTEVSLTPAGRDALSAAAPERARAARGRLARGKVVLET